LDSFGERNKTNFSSNIWNYQPERMLTLKEVVDRYSSLAKQGGEPVALEAFALDPEETIKLFTSLDEDYHISRFVKFSFDNGRLYLISGNPSTHVRIDAAIRELF
jgi:hypothetical protein